MYVDLEIKIVVVVMLFTFIIIWTLPLYGGINIEFTGSTEIARLTELNSACNEKLDTKCDPCPEVKCIGDVSFPMLMIGLFFGFIGGAVFTLHFGQKLQKEFDKQLKGK